MLYWFSYLNLDMSKTLAVGNSQGSNGKSSFVLVREERRMASTDRLCLIVLKTRQHACPVRSGKGEIGVEIPSLSIVQDFAN